MKKKIVGILTVCALCMGLISTAALASNSGTSVTDSEYTINLESIPEQAWNESKITVKFILDGDTKNPIIVFDDPELGTPVRLDISSMNGSVSFLPIRAICNALKLNCKWVEATDKDGAHALIGTPKGQVKLYAGATSITAEDGTVYQEETYLFPDGSHIPLCMVREGRIYVPVRFLSTFVLGNVKYDWSKNGTLLTVTGGSQESGLEGFEGIGVNTDLMFDVDNPLASLPNTKLVVEKYGVNAACAGDNTNVFIRGGAVDMRINEDEIIIRGFGYSANDVVKYEATCSLIRDVCDKESADALVNWLDELDNKQSDTTVSDAEFMAFLKEKATKDKETKFGNVNVSFGLNDVGGISSIINSKA